VAGRIDLNIVANADFRSVNAQIAQLRKTVAALNEQFSAQGGISPQQVQSIRNAVSEYEKIIHASGAFKSTMVDVADQTEKFGQHLQNGKLKLNEYFKVWREGSDATSGSIRELAKQQVALSQAVVRSDPFKQGRAYVDQVRSIDEVANRTKIATTQQQLFNLSLARGGDEMIKWGKNTQWAGRQMMVGMTIPIALFGKTAAKAFIDFDKEMTRVVKVYGSGMSTASEQVTTKLRADVTKLAQDMARTYGIAMSETAAMTAEIAATGLTGPELLNATTQATRLATLGEVDRQEAVKATIAMQNVFKLNTQDLTEAINFLNGVENQTSTSLQDIVDAIPKASPVIAQLGGSYKDVAVMMVAMREAGVPAAEAANAVKSAVDKLINPTRKAREMMAGFGIDLEGIVAKNAGNIPATLAELENALSKLSDLQRSQAIGEIFGTYQFARVSALLDNINDKGSQTATVFKMMGASASDMAALAQSELDTLANSVSGKYQRALESLKAAIIPFGERMLKFITPIIEGITHVADFINNNPFLQNVVSWGAGLLALVGPIIMTVGVFGNFLGYLLKGVATLKNLKDGFRGFIEIATPESIAAAKAGDLFQKSLLSQSEAAGILTNAIARLNAQLAQYQGYAGGPGGPGGPGGGPGGYPSPPYKPKPSDIVTGPGGPKGDQIPAMLSDGEAILTADAANTLGRGTIKMLNGGSGFIGLPDKSQQSNNAVGIEGAHSLAASQLIARLDQWVAEGSEESKLIGEMIRQDDAKYELEKEILKLKLESLTATGEQKVAAEKQLEILRKNAEALKIPKETLQLIDSEDTQKILARQAKVKDKARRERGVTEKFAQFMPPSTTILPSIPSSEKRGAGYFQQQLQEVRQSMYIPPDEVLEKYGVNFEDIADDYLKALAQSAVSPEKAMEAFATMTLQDKKDFLSSAKLIGNESSKLVLDKISGLESEKERRAAVRKFASAMRNGGEEFETWVTDFDRQFSTNLADKIQYNISDNSHRLTEAIDRVVQSPEYLAAGDASGGVSPAQQTMIRQALEKASIEIDDELDAGIVAKFRKFFGKSGKFMLGDRMFAAFSGRVRQMTDPGFSLSVSNLENQLADDLTKNVSRLLGITGQTVTSELETSLKQVLINGQRAISTAINPQEEQKALNDVKQALRNLGVLTEKQIEEVANRINRNAAAITQTGINTKSSWVSRIFSPFTRNKKAGGGKISGPGGPREDRVPAMLSDGEYVINAKAVNNVGTGFLDAINSGKFVAGYADGTPPSGDPISTDPNYNGFEMPDFEMPDADGQAGPSDSPDKPEKRRRGMGSMRSAMVGGTIFSALQMLQGQLGDIDNQFVNVGNSAMQFGSMGMAIAGPWGAAAGAIVGALKGIADEQQKVAQGFKAAFVVGQAEADLLGLKLHKIAALDIQLYNDKVAVSSERVQALTDKITALPEDDPLQMFAKSLTAQDTTQAMATLQQKYMTLRVAGVDDKEARAMVRAIMRAAGVEGAMGNISLGNEKATQEELLSGTFKNAPKTFNTRTGFTDWTQKGLAIAGNSPVGMLTNLAAGNSPLDFLNQSKEVFSGNGASLMQNALHSFATEDMHSLKNNLMFFGPEFDKMRKSIEGTAGTLNEFIQNTDSTKLYDQIKKLEDGLKGDKQATDFFKASIRELFTQMGEQGQKAYEYMQSVGTSSAGMLEAIRAVQIGAISDLETAMAMGEEKLHKLYLEVSKVYEANKKIAAANAKAQADYSKAAAKAQTDANEAAAAANEANRKATEAANAAIDAQNKALQKAIDIEEARIAALQKEKEERQKILDRIKKALDYEKLQLSLRNQMREALASGNLLKFAELQQQSRVEAAKRNADVQTDKFNDAIDALIEQIRLLIQALKDRMKDHVENPPEVKPGTVNIGPKPKPTPETPIVPKTLEGPAAPVEESWWDTVRRKYIDPFLDAIWPDNISEILDSLWPDDWATVFDNIWPDDWSKVGDALWPDDLGKWLDSLWPDDWEQFFDNIWPDANRWEQTQQMFGNLWKNITSTVTDFASTAWGNITSAMGLPKDASFVDILFEILHKLYAGLMSFESMVDQLWDNINAGLGLPKGSGIIQWIGAIFNKFVTFTISIGQWAQQQYDNVLTNLGLPKGSNLWDIIKRVGELFFQNIVSVKTWAQNKYKEFLKNLGLPESASLWNVIELVAGSIFKKVKRIKTWIDNRYKEFLVGLGLPADATAWDIVKLPFQKLFDKVVAVTKWIDDTYKDMLKNLGLPPDAGPLDIIKLVIGKLFAVKDSITKWATDSFDEVKENMGLSKDATIMDVITSAISTFFGGAVDVATWIAEKIFGEGNAPDFNAIVGQVLDAMWPDTWDFSTITGHQFDITQAVYDFLFPNGVSFDFSTLTGGQFDASIEIWNAISGWWKTITDAGGPLPWIQSKLGGIWTGVTNFATEIWNKIAGLWDTNITIGSVTLGAPSTWIGKIFGSITNLVSSFWTSLTGLWNTDITIGSTQLGAPSTWVGKIFTGLSNLASGAWDSVASLWNTTIGNLGEPSTWIGKIFTGVSNLAENAYTSVKGIWDTTATVAGNVIGSPSTWMAGLFGGITNLADDSFKKIKGLWDTSVNVGGSALGGVSGWVAKIFPGISNIADNVFKKIKELWDTTTKVGGQIIGNPSTWIDKIFSGLTNIASNIYTTIQNKISAMWKGVKDAIFGYFSGSADRGTYHQGLLDKVTLFFTQIFTTFYDKLRAAGNWLIEQFNRIPVLADISWRIPALAMGGPIYGPGSSTSDSIPARLSNGEFVVRAAAVQKYGLSHLNAMNSMALEPNYNMGGMVSAYAMGGPAYSIPQTNGTMVGAGSAYQNVNNTFHITGDNPQAIANEVVRMINLQQRRTGVMNRV
jgi:TP901 family phage tail tape measure protein